MSNQLPNNSQLTKNSQLLRDLTLSTDAPLSFCIRLLLQKMNWIGNQSKLLDLFGNDPSNMDLVDARNIMFKLGYTSIQEELNSWDQLNSASLPALYLSTKLCCDAVDRSLARVNNRLYNASDGCFRRLGDLSR